MGTTKIATAGEKLKKPNVTNRLTISRAANTIAINMGLKTIAGVNFFLSSAHCMPFSVI
jgi:hypothetical protein